MDQNKLRVLMETFKNSQIQCCPLMFQSRKPNTKINKLHECALRITNRDQESSFEDLLKLHNSVSVQQKSLQVLMIEMFKTRQGLHPSLISEILCPQTNKYSLRSDRVFNIPNVRSVEYGLETVRSRGQQLWCLNFHYQRQCHFRLCRKFLPLLGFI